MDILHDPAGDIGKLLLRPEEAAKLLSIGRSKVYELIGTGELRSVRIGASRRIPTDALLDFVSQLSRRLSGSAAPQEPA